MGPEVEGQEMTDNPFAIKHTCNWAREQLKNLEKTLRNLENHSEIKVIQNDQAYPGQLGEMLAQAKLAIRAIEDARMRCGKVLQYMGDGVSIYDKVNKA